MMPLRSVVLALVMVLAVGGATAAPLRIATQSLPETRGDPFSYAGLPPGLIVDAIFDRLLQVDDHGVPQPGLAIAWTQETPVTWVFTLRPGVSFSNGEQCNADAVVAALQTILTTTVPPDMLTGTTVRERVAEVRARDPETVVITTRGVDPILPLHLFAVRVPAPEAWRKGEGFANHPVGSGPYQVAAWQTERVSLVRNPTAWRRATVDALDLRVLPDQTARVLALAADQVDVAIDLPADAARSFADPNIRLVPRRGTLTSYFQFVTVGDSPLKDVRVRRALNYAVDKQRLIRAFLNDAVEPATQFAQENAFGFDPSLRAYPYDPAKAKALLAEAGFAKGFDLPAVFVGGAGADLAIYQEMAADLGKVGVKLELRSVTMSTFMGHLMSGSWPALAFATGVQGDDSLAGLRARFCDFMKSLACDENERPLFAAAREAQSAAGLREALRGLLAYEHDHPPGLLLWRKAAFDGLGPRVSDFPSEHDRIVFERITAAPR